MCVGGKNEMYVRVHKHEEAVCLLETVTQRHCTEGCRLTICSRWSQVIPCFQCDEMPSEARRLPSFIG
jgi:hypothetical protein